MRKKKRAGAFFKLCKLFIEVIGTASAEAVYCLFFIADQKDAVSADRPYYLLLNRVHVLIFVDENEGILTFYFFGYRPVLKQFQTEVFQIAVVELVLVPLYLRVLSFEIFNYRGKSPGRDSAFQKPVFFGFPVAYIRANCLELRIYFVPERLEKRTEFLFFLCLIRRFPRYAQRRRNRKQVA